MAEEEKKGEVEPSPQLINTMVMGEEDGYVPTMSEPDGFFGEEDGGACSVKVCVRVRPFIGRELRDGSSKKAIVTVDPNGRKLQVGATREFAFDQVFGADSEQSEMYRICSKNQILGCFDGYNATILAYGQTGSGKTHSMGTGSTIGLPAEQIGIVPRVFDFIFEELANRQKQSELSQFTVKCQFLELYLEELHDLLDMTPPGKDGGGKEIRIREETNGSITIQGLSAEEISNKAECVNLLNRGIAKRVTSATQMNEGSSRSHAIFTIIIDQKIVSLMPALEGAEEGGDGEPVTQTENISAKFHFVDLAGSERIKKTGAAGKQMAEGININKGLLALGNVISALTGEKMQSGANAHIPYRDSKLTRILQDSLGGNSRTTMIACVSPAESNHEESLSTIKYASRARNIKNKPVVNRDANSLLIESLRTQVVQLSGEIIEYHVLLKFNNIEIPFDLKERADQKRQERSVAPSSGKTPALPMSMAAQSQGQVMPNLQRRDSNASSVGIVQSASLSDLRNMKLELARKDRQLKQMEEQLEEERKKTSSGQEGNQALQQERDQLVMHQEHLQGILDKNKISSEEKPHASSGASQGGKRSQTLIDEYKVKVSKSTQELEKQKAELMAKSKKIAELQTQIKRDEAVLKKTTGENVQLKLAAKRGKIDQSASPATQKTDRRQKSSSMREKRDTEEIKTQFMDKLTSQLESMFADAGDFDEEEKKSDSAEQTELEAEAITEETILEVAKAQHNSEGNEKILALVKESRKLMQQNLEELFSNSGNILDLQTQKNKVEKQLDKNAKDFKLDEKQIKEAEKKYKTQLETLNKQLSQAEQVKKKSESKLAKDLSVQEARIKALELEVEKHKKQREEVTQAKKYGEERFSKFKVSANADLKTKTKTVQESKATVTKLKTDLKKADQKAQTKIAELRGLQKKARDEKDRRVKEESRENEKKGIDVDAIKDWIHLNTEQMVKNRELSVYLKESEDQKDEIEDEMLDLGDRLTELMVQRNRDEIEQEQLNRDKDEGTEVDEARVLEIEQELESLNMEQEGITDTLDNLQEHMEFLEEKINEMRLEINSYDMENIMPPRFQGLNNVSVAKATLRTFFLVLLDLNVYKKELENKCLEQDERMLELNLQLSIFREQDPASMSYAEQQAKLRKQAQMNKIVGSLGSGVDFVDEREAHVEGMTMEEKTELTKMSLSKIVSNLRSKLKGEENKNLNLSNKLEAAIKEKELLKQKQKQLERQMKRGGGAGLGGPLFTTAVYEPKPPPASGAPAARTASPRGGRAAPDKEKNDPGASERPQRSRIDTGLGAVKASAAAARERGDKMSPTTKRLSFKERRDLQKMNEKKTSEFKLGGTASSGNVPTNTNRKEKLLFKGATPQTQSSLEEKRNKIKQQKQQQAIDVIQTEAAKIAGVGSTLPPEVILEEEEEGEDEEKKQFIPFPSDEDEEEAAARKLEAELYAEEMEADDFFNIDQEEKLQITNWKLETVTGLPMDEGVKMIDFALLGDRIFVLYDDLSFFEISVASKDTKMEIMLPEIEGASAIEGQKATAFQVQQEIELFAVATSTCLALYDCSGEELQFISMLDVANVIKIHFFDCHVVLCIEDEYSDDVILRCYETQELIEGSDPVTQITVKRFMAAEIIFRADSDSIYFAVGKQIGRIRVPEMEIEYQEDSGHAEPIMDFVVSQRIIYTTSQDESMHIFDIDSGMQVIAPMSEMECDTLASSGSKVIMRCGGEAILIFKYVDGEEELEDIGMVEMTADESLAGTAFKMQGGSLKVTLSNGKTYDVILIAQQNEEGLLVKLLTSEAF